MSNDNPPPVFLRLALCLAPLVCTAAWTGSAHAQQPLQAQEQAQVQLPPGVRQFPAAALRATLGRIDDDSGYGVCIDCRAFIGVDRLLALPAATRCIRCAS